MDSTSHPSRRAIFAGLGGLAAGAVGARYLAGAPAQAATFRPEPVHASPPRLVSATGTWFGAYPGPGNAQPQAWEAMVGRHLDVVKRYELLDGVWPNAADRELIVEGRWLCACWSSRLRTGSMARWADVATGRYDAQILAQAKRLAQVGPIWVGYDDEMDGRVRTAASGPLTDYPAAYRRIRELVRPIAPNVIWYWCPTGGNRTPEVAACYPGDDYIDWIGYDPYDATLSKGGPLATYKPFPEWLDSQRIGHGKAIGIMETGFHRDVDDAHAAADWIDAVPAALSELGIKMWLWFNSSGGLGDTSMAPATAAASALRNIGTERMLRQRHW